MTPQFHCNSVRPKLDGGKLAGHPAAAPATQKRAWRFLNRRALIALLTLFSIALIYSLHLYKLQETRRQVRAELTLLLRAEKPDVTGIIAAFDHSTEDVFFAACGPYLILAVTVVFLTGQLLGIKQRLNAAERRITVLRN